MKRLPIPQPEFSFTRDSFNLAPPPAAPEAVRDWAAETRAEVERANAAAAKATEPLPWRCEPRHASEVCLNCDEVWQGPTALCPACQEAAEAELEATT